MSDVFISYSRQDQDFVHKLNDALKVRDRESWVDWEQIRIAEDWWRRIQEAIAATDTFVFVITPDSLASNVCREEVDYASSLNKRIVPILRVAVSKESVATMHHALSTHNWLYFQESNDFDKVFEDLLGAIDSDPVHTKEHTRLLIRAIEWEVKGRRNDSLLRGKDLEEAEKWLTESGTKSPRPTEIQIVYIQSSRKIEDANRQAIQILENAKAQAAGEIAIANVYIDFLDAKAAFKEDRLFDALLQAVRAGHKLKSLDPDLLVKNEKNIQIVGIANLSHFVYGVKEKINLLIPLLSLVSPLVPMASPLPLAVGTEP